MPQAVSVILDTGKRQLDLNTMGLVKMRFDRMLGSTQAQDTNFLTNLDITLFDYEGGNIMMSILQESEGKIFLKYGFSDYLSNVYSLEAIKYKVTYEEMGCMIAIKAIAKQVRVKTQPELFNPGTSVRQLLIELAKRNKWYIGNSQGNDINNYISIPSTIVLNEPLYKVEEYDFDFIRKHLLPLANRSVYVTGTNIPTEAWDVNLLYENGLLTFYFRERNTRKVNQRVWKYSYGDTFDNRILSLTNTIDMSFLLNGLTVKIPSTRAEMYSENSEDIAREKLEANIALVERLIKDYGIPLPNLESFKFNVELVPSDDVGNMSEDQYIANALEQATQTVSTIEMTVIGNPEIMTNDLIDLVVKNRSGDNTIITASKTSMWKVVGISEEIGVNGYTTNLTLVRQRVSTINSYINSR